MDERPSTAEPGERRPAHQLERPPSERYATADDTATADAAPPPMVRAIVIAFLAAIVGGLAIAIGGGILTITAGLLVVAAVLGWVVGAVFTMALGPTPPGGRAIRRSFAAVIAVLGVALGQVGLWLIAREEGGTLAIGDYLAEVFGLLVPAEFAIAAVVAWWRAR